jgi:hypothetical protein
LFDVAVDGALAAVVRVAVSDGLVEFGDGEPAARGFEES